MSVMKADPLPQPGQALAIHSDRLAALIASEITQAGGSIGFDRYMELALYAPGLGYYSAGLRKFGSTGDFVTAPEVSSIYSYCLANQCRQLLETLQGASILEFGAGSGRMACDLLDRLRQSGSLPERYLILETSADLRDRQVQLLRSRQKDYFSRLAWLDRLPSTPMDAVVIANEVVDALPFQRVVLRRGEVAELVVGVDDGGFTWCERLQPSGISAYCERYLRGILDSGVTDYRTEVHGNYAPWLTSIAACLERGVILLADYGYSGREYYSAERDRGTLMCHYRHRAHGDPFWFPGLQDITASVNFTVLRDIATEIDLELLGYTTQSGFLLANGIGEVYGELVSRDEAEPQQLAAEIRTLTLPAGMGERFRFLALGKNVSLGMQGFDFRDLTHQL